jgi:TatD DNase family protein
MRLFDAHVHLQDPKISRWLSQLLAELPQVGLEGAVVNGTSESDWSAVAQLARRAEWVVPSFGLHPWWVGTESTDWLDRLERCLRDHPNSGVGEIGLHQVKTSPARHGQMQNRGLKNPSISEQVCVLVQQIKLAARMNRVITLHCFQAWTEMAAVLSNETLPSRGFLIHAYSGDASLVPLLLDRGAYFSFNGYNLGERHASRKAIFERLPSNRILVETDAPALALPKSLIEFRFQTSGNEGPDLNHPANLVVTYRELARLRKTEYALLVDQVADNFAALFGGPRIKSSQVPPL